ncbi:MAG: amino acid permease [Candidatus Kapabacteria bacterium]|nr:amino acid permease [Candidatus Kapabacteria bacterium]
MRQTYRLGMFDLVMLVISLVIGMGIFRTPATVAAKSGSETIFYLAWLAGGVIALCGALTFAEIGRRMPVTGAYYRVFAKAYHPLLAFGVNIIIVVSNAASAAGVSIIGAEYLGRIWPDLNVIAVACGFIALLYGVNLVGLRTSVTMQNILIGVKLLLLATIIGTPLIVEPAAASIAAPAASVEGSWITALGVSLIAVAFTYGGYQQTINFGGEASSSGNAHVSRAILMGVVCITGIYLLATWAYVHVLGFSTLAGSSAIASLVMERLMGSTGERVVSVAMLISVFGYVNVSMLSNPRVVSAMAEDGMVSKRLVGHDSSKGRGVNVMTLTLYTALMMLCVFFGRSFETILNYTIFLDCIGMATAAGALFLLGSPQALSRGIVATASVFIAAYLFIASSIYLDDPMAALSGLLLLAAVIAVKFAIDRVKPRT